MLRTEIAVVLPTCRGYEPPAQDIPVDWIIVHDREEWRITENDEGYRWWNNHARGNSDSLWRLDSDLGVRVPAGDPMGNGHTLYSPRIIENLIAPNPELYGERTSAIRQAGLDYAYASGYKYVLTVDDDCTLPADWARQHVMALRGSVPLAFNTVPGEVIRGIPVGATRPVGISHGLWSGILDYPAWYQLAAKPAFKILVDHGWSHIASPFPMCGMNVGFRREVLPAVYFQHRFLRHDDIFAGWVAQQLLDIEGYGFVSGGAVVDHERASNAAVNLEKEQPGDDINEALLRHILKFHTTTRDLPVMFAEMCMHLTYIDLGKTYQKMVQDMADWAMRKENQ